MEGNHSNSGLQSTPESDKRLTACAVQSSSETANARHDGVSAPETQRSLRLAPVPRSGERKGINGELPGAARISNPNAPDLDQSHTDPSSKAEPVLECAVAGSDSLSADGGAGEGCPVSGTDAAGGAAGAVAEPSTPRASSLTPRVMAPFSLQMAHTLSAAQRAASTGSLPVASLQRGTVAPGAGSIPGSSKQPVRRSTRRRLSVDVDASPDTRVNRVAQLLSAPSRHRRQSAADVLSPLRSARSATTVPGYLQPSSVHPSVPSVHASAPAEPVSPASTPRLRIAAPGQALSGSDTEAKPSGAGAAVSSSSPLSLHRTLSTPGDFYRFTRADHVQRAAIRAVQFEEGARAAFEAPNAWLRATPAADIFAQPGPGMPLRPTRRLSSSVYVSPDDEGVAYYTSVFGGRPSPALRPAGSADQATVNAGITARVGTDIPSAAADDEVQAQVASAGLHAIAEAAEPGIAQSAIAVSDVLIPISLGPQAGTASSFEGEVASSTKQVPGPVSSLVTPSPAAVKASVPLQTDSGPSPRVSTVGSVVPAMIPHMLPAPIPIPLDQLEPVPPAVVTSEDIMQTDVHTGLSASVAASRLSLYGYNEMQEHKPSRLRKFLGYAP